MQTTSTSSSFNSLEDYRAGVARADNEVCNVAFNSLEDYPRIPIFAPLLPIKFTFNSLEDYLIIPDELHNNMSEDTFNSLEDYRREVPVGPRKVSKNFQFPRGLSALKSLRVSSTSRGPFNSLEDYP